LAAHVQHVEALDGPPLIDQGQGHILVARRIVNARMGELVGDGHLQGMQAAAPQRDRFRPRQSIPCQFLFVPGGGPSPPAPPWWRWSPALPGGRADPRPGSAPALSGRSAAPRSAPGLAASWPPDRFMARTDTKPSTSAKPTTPAVAKATGHTMETNPPRPRPRRTNQREFIATAMRVT